MMHRKISALSVEHSFEPLLRKGLFACLIVLAGAYIYFVGSSVMHIIERKEANAQSARLANAISSMEKEYFAYSESIDYSSVASAGLSPISTLSYVYRPGNSASAATISPDAI
jgi:hypothetical protein